MKTKISYKDALCITTLVFNEYYKGLEEEERKIFKYVDKTDTEAFYKAIRQALPIRLELDALEPIASSLNDGVSPDALYLDALFNILSKSKLSNKILDNIFTLLA